MNKADKLYRKIKSLSEKIAGISAYRLENSNDWWGKDTSLGDIKIDIQKELSMFIDWYDKNKQRR